MLLEKALATLASLVARHVPLALAGLVLVVGAAFWLCEKVHTPSLLGGRMGACPCCGRALFGTTSVSQHLHGLDLVCPESPSLCLTCDRTTIAALHYHYRAERAEE
jgi:hypothetical protein